MQLTGRDVEIIRWIDSFGYVTAQQVFERFNFQPGVGYRRLRLLVRNRYLVHKRFFVGRPGIYQAAGQGLALVAEDPEQFTWYRLTKLLSYWKFGCFLLIWSGRCLSYGQKNES